MKIEGIPWWVFVVCGVTAIALGRGIRWWLDNKKIMEANRLKEKQKEIKKLMKRSKKQAKKGKKGKSAEAAKQEENDVIEKT